MLIRRISFLILCVVLLASPAFGQEDDAALLASFQKNFLRASIAIKIQVLQDAAKVENLDMGPLYLQAVEFVLDNIDVFQGDPTARQLAVLGVRLIGLSGYDQASRVLWDYFTADSNTTVRIEILSAFGHFGSIEPEIVSGLNGWLSEQNDRFQTGKEVDFSVVSECVIALGLIGDRSSFSVLFTSSVIGYPDDIVRKARESLFSIEGDFKELVTLVIRKNPLPEKLAALRLAMGNDRLGDEDRGEIAEEALSIGIYSASSELEDRESLRQIRYEAIAVITEYRWFRATSLAIDHFDLTLIEYDRGIGRKSHVLDAVRCLGAMGTYEAAERLTLYLDLINSYVENGRNIDEDIVLGVIENLALLGDKVAFDYLLYTGYLDYSEKVKKAAREALNKL